MSQIKAEVRSGAYYDSAFLMQLQRSLSELPGVDDAGVVIGGAQSLRAGQAFPRKNGRYMAQI